MTTPEWYELMEARERLARNLGTQDYVLKTLFSLLQEIREELDDRSDADYEDESYRPNWAMRLVQQIDRGLESAKTTLRKHGLETP